MLRFVHLSDAWAAAEALRPCSAVSPELVAVGKRQADTVGLAPADSCCKGVFEEDQELSTQLLSERTAAVWRARLPALQEVAFVSALCLCCPVDVHPGQEDGRTFQNAASALVFFCDVLEALLSPVPSVASCGVRLRCSSLFLLGEFCPIGACCTQRFVQLSSPSLVHLLVVFPPSSSVIPLLISRRAAAILLPSCLSTGTSEFPPSAETSSAPPPTWPSFTSPLLSCPTAKARQENRHQDFSQDSLSLQGRDGEDTEATGGAGGLGRKRDSFSDTVGRAGSASRKCLSAHFLFGSLQSLQLVNFHPRLHLLFSRASFLWPEDLQVLGPRGLPNFTSKAPPRCDGSAAREAGPWLDGREKDSLAYYNGLLSRHSRSSTEEKLLLSRASTRRCNSGRLGTQGVARLLLSLVWDEDETVESQHKSWPARSDTGFEPGPSAESLGKARTEKVDSREEVPRPSAYRGSETANERVMVETDCLSDLFDRALMEYLAVRETLGQHKSFATELIDHLVRKLPPFCLVLPPSGKQTARLLALLFSPAISSLFSCQISRQRAVEFVAPLRIDAEGAWRVLAKAPDGDAPSVRGTFLPRFSRSARQFASGVLVEPTGRERSLTEKDKEAGAGVYRVAEGPLVPSQVRFRKGKLSLSNCDGALALETSGERLDGDDGRVGFPDSTDLHEESRFFQGYEPLVELVVIFKLLTSVALLEQGTVFRPSFRGGSGIRSRPRSATVGAGWGSDRVRRGGGGGGLQAAAGCGGEVKEGGRQDGARAVLRGEGTPGAHLSGGGTRASLVPDWKKVETGQAASRRGLDSWCPADLGSRTRPNGARRFLGCRKLDGSCAESSSKADRKEDAAHAGAEFGRPERTFVSSWAERLALLMSINCESGPAREDYDASGARQKSAPQKTPTRDGREGRRTAGCQPLHQRQPEDMRTRTLREISSEMTGVRQFRKEEVALKPSASALSFLRQQTESAVERKSARERKELLRERSAGRSNRCVARRLEKVEWLLRRGAGLSGTKASTTSEGQDGHDGGDKRGSTEGKNDPGKDARSEERGNFRRNRERREGRGVDRAAAEGERGSEEEEEADRVSPERLLAKGRPLLGTCKGEGQEKLDRTTRRRVCEGAFVSRQSEGPCRVDPATSGGSKTWTEATTNRRRGKGRGHAFSAPPTESCSLHWSLSYADGRSRLPVKAVPRRSDSDGLSSFSLRELAQGFSDKVAAWWVVEEDRSVEERSGGELGRSRNRKPRRQASLLHRRSSSSAGEHALPVPPRVAVRRRRERDGRGQASQVTVRTRERGGPEPGVVGGDARSLVKAERPSARAVRGPYGSVGKGENSDSGEDEEEEKAGQRKSGDGAAGLQHWSKTKGRSEPRQAWGCSDEGKLLELSDSEIETEGAHQAAPRAGPGFFWLAGADEFVRKLTQDQSTADGQGWSQERMTTSSGAPVRSDSSESLLGQSSMGDFVKELFSSLTRQASGAVDSAKVFLASSLRSRDSFAGASVFFTPPSAGQGLEGDAGVAKEQVARGVSTTGSAKSGDGTDGWSFASLQKSGEENKSLQEISCQGHRSAQYPRGENKESLRVAGSPSSSSRKWNKLFGEPHPYACVQGLQVLLVPVLSRSAPFCSLDCEMSAQHGGLRMRASEEDHACRSREQLVPRGNQAERKKQELPENVGMVRSGEPERLPPEDPCLADAGKAATSEFDLPSVPAIVFCEFLSCALSSDSAARTALIRLLRLGLPQLQHLLFCVADITAASQASDRTLSCALEALEQGRHPELARSGGASVLSLSSSSSSIPSRGASEQTTRYEQPPQRHRLSTLLAALGFRRLEVCGGVSMEGHSDRSSEEPSGEEQLSAPSGNSKRAVGERSCPPASHVGLPPVLCCVHSEFGSSLAEVRLGHMHVVSGYMREPAWSGEKVRRISMGSSAERELPRSFGSVFLDSPLHAPLFRPPYASSVHYSAVAPHLISASLSRTMSVGFAINSRLPSAALMFGQANQLGERIYGWLSEVGRGVSRLDMPTGSARRLASSIQDAVTVAFRVVAEEVEGTFGEEGINEREHTRTDS